jgi:superfamily I DNA/RNA helicase
VDYTDEQQAIIRCHAPVVVADAKAGTGKTTTAVGFSASRPDKKFLYVAFNKTVQMEATERFGAKSNTEARTHHSLAFGAVGRHYGERVTHSWRALGVKNELQLNNTRMAGMVQLTLTKFFQSTDESLTQSHARDAEHKFRAQEHEMSEAVANAKILWRRMQDRSDSVAVPHDAYLKMWALTKPRLNYDYLICDEWQDANPVTAQIVEQQRHAKVLILGDPHQSIYAFRGAINAMDQFPSAERLHLSKTWRFGPKVAEIANLLLSEFKREKVLIKAMGVDVPYRSGAPVTKLARTNAQLFKDATLVMGQGVHWVGGVEKYELQKILDAYYLFANQRDRIRDPFLRFFSSFQELAAYAEDAKDREAKILVEVIEEYRHETPRLVHEVTKNAVAESADAQLVLTTAHKAKGLDWDYVQIANDFEILADTEALLADDPYAQIEQQEINLLYVAFTRAKKELALNDETKQWLHNLPQHQAARAHAAARTRERMQARPSPA